MTRSSGAAVATACVLAVVVVVLTLRSPLRASAASRGNGREIGMDQPTPSVLPIPVHDSRRAEDGVGAGSTTAVVMAHALRLAPSSLTHTTAGAVRGRVGAMMDNLSSRLTAGIHMGETLPYLRVRYPPIRTSSTPSFPPASASITTIHVELPEDAGTDVPQLDTSEAYTLDVAADGHVRVAATSLSGVARAVETFSQLVHYNGSHLVMPHLPLAIRDEPRFAWRGLLLDSARHFIPELDMLHALDGMAALKLNVLHWHITDSQAFPLQLESVPELSRHGALHPKLVYSRDQVARIVDYASARGIRVVPEIDIPGHAASWGFGRPDIVVHCDAITDGDGLEESVNRVALHPLRDATWDVIERVLVEVAELFPDQYLHLGGDEVDARCWQQDEEIAAYMRQQRKDPRQVQAEFTNRVVEMAHKLGKTVVLWEEAFESGVRYGLSKDVVVDVWHNARLAGAAASAGHKVVLSWGAYLDRYNPVDGRGHWASFQTWTDMYKYMLRPLAVSRGAHMAHAVIGAEASSWAESVDAVSSDERVFHRLPAVAERLWSPPLHSQDEEACRVRMAELRCKLLRGLAIRAGPVFPDYCDHTHATHGTARLHLADDAGNTAAMDAVVDAEGTTSVPAN